MAEMKGRIKSVGSISAGSNCGGNGAAKFAGDLVHCMPQNCVTYSEISPWSERGFLLSFTSCLYGLQTVAGNCVC